jgi:UDP-N-acetylmuramoylalanine--D-glutamate ligase
VTTGIPEPGQFGVRDGMLVDGGGRELVPAEEIHPAGTHNVSNALHAAASPSSSGGSAGGRRALGTPQPHRNAYLATVAGVSYVDDSKATNPHAAFASLTAYPRIVWIAGGALKGVNVGDLVASVAPRLVGAVLLGADRAEVARALERHAPHLPVVEVVSTDDGAMGEVVRAAARLARPGDTVLLAPAAASLDMFESYARRGEAFAAAVRRCRRDRAQGGVDRAQRAGVVTVRSAPPTPHGPAGGLSMLRGMLARPLASYSPVAVSCGLPS